MEMQDIDAKKALDNAHMKEFLSCLEDDCIVAVIKDESFEYTKVTLRNFFLNDKIAALVTDKNEEISFAHSNAVIRFIGADYLWYKNKEKRVNDLFAENLEEKPKKEKKEKPADVELRVAVGSRKNGVVVDAEQFAGKKKDCIIFMNKQYAERQLKSHFEDDTVFNLGFSNIEELNDLSNWFTMDELSSSGIIEVEQ